MRNIQLAIPNGSTKHGAQSTVYFAFTRSRSEVLGRETSFYPKGSMSQAHSRELYEVR